MSSEEARRRAPTIYDVAKEADVSPSTVSRALARPGRVSAETAEHVRKAAAKIGYRRSPLAPALRQVPSRLIGLIVPDIGNPVFVGVVRGAEAEAERSRYTPMLFDTRESDMRERVAADSFIDAVDGLIMTSPRLSDSGLVALAKQRPTIVLNRVVQGLPSILTDGARGMRRVAEHLGQLGHQEITYISGPESSWANGVRWRGLQEAGVELELKVRRTPSFEPTVPGGERAVQSWAQNPSTAIATYNDIMALGVIRGLRSRGVEVPRDVSVVGFDNSRIGALTTPALTSVASPLALQGAIAVRNLLAIIDGAKSENQPVYLPVKLVVRESTGRRRYGALAATR